MCFPEQHHFCGVWPQHHDSNSGQLYYDPYTFPSMWDPSWEEPKSDYPIESGNVKGDIQPLGDHSGIKSDETEERLKNMEQTLQKLQEE